MAGSKRKSSRLRRKDDPLSDCALTGDAISPVLEVCIVVLACVLASLKGFLRRISECLTLSVVDQHNLWLRLGGAAAECQCGQ